MDADPDALHPPLGAIPADADLGAISPELALVDPELARRARELLPEPRERPKPPRPLPVEPEPAPEPEVRRRRRWPRAIALAVVIFAAGAVSGSLLGNHQTQTSSPATTLEVRAAEPAHTVRQPTTTRAVLRPPKVVRTGTTKASPAPRRQRRRHAPVVWATNVLGVEATVGRRGVRLLWQPPADSARVVVLRKRGSRPSVVVYRGRARIYRDTSLRSCTGYGYTIVNYDRRGHRSTGVPTSVVTLCA
jgi:hypothetical protein